MSFSKFHRVFHPLDEPVLDKENRHYLERVMRLRPGDEFLVTPGNGTEILARLEEQGGFSILSESRPNREPAVQVIVYAALIKGDRFEWLVEKAIELGAVQIVPLITQRVVKKSVSLGKIQRWRKIAISAMLQSGGCRVPEIPEPVSIEQVPTFSAPSAGGAFFLHEETLDARAVFPGSLPSHHVSLLSGPEGGLTTLECNLLEKKGWQRAWLGPRRLRAETAPLMAISRVLQWESGESSE